MAEIGVWAFGIRRSCREAGKRFPVPARPRRAGLGWVHTHCAIGTCIYTTGSMVVASDNNREFTADEIETANSTEKLWIIIHGNVYDVTDFKIEHPGGPDVLINAAGNHVMFCIWVPGTSVTIATHQNHRRRCFSGL